MTLISLIINKNYLGIIILKKIVNEKFVDIHGNYMLKELCSFITRSYFWLKEPKIIIKIFNGFLPVGHKKDSLYSIDSCS